MYSGRLILQSNRNQLYNYSYENDLYIFSMNIELN